MFIYEFVYLFIHLYCILQRPCVYIYVSVSMHLQLCIYIYAPMPMRLCLCIYLVIYLLIHLNYHASIRQSNLVKSAPTYSTLPESTLL